VAWLFMLPVEFEALAEYRIGVTCIVAWPGSFHFSSLAVCTTKLAPFSKGGILDRRGMA